MPVHLLLVKPVRCHHDNNVSAGRSIASCEHDMIVLRVGMSSPNYTVRETP
jgi:hypothetical protein